MHDCIVNIRKDCESANSHFKSSDTKKLSADTKILIALRKKQPQKRLELIKNAAINPSTFNRYKRLLINQNIIKEGAKGYSLSDFDERPSLWDRLLKKANVSSNDLVDLTVEKLVLGDQDPITGWFEKIYQKRSNIRGLLILKGAEELQSLASIVVPAEYSAFLLTKDFVDQADRFIWREKSYEVHLVKEIYDGNDFSYRIAKLMSPNVPWGQLQKGSLA